MQNFDIERELDEMGLTKQDVRVLMSFLLASVASLFALLGLAAFIIVKYLS